MPDNERQQPTSDERDERPTSSESPQIIEEDGKRYMLTKRGTRVRMMSAAEYAEERGTSLMAVSFGNGPAKDWPPAPPSARAAQRAHARLAAYAASHACEPSEPPAPPDADAERVKIPKPWWQMWLWAKANGCGDLMRHQNGDDDA